MHKPFCLMNLTRILAFPFKNSRCLNFENESYKISFSFTRILSFTFKNSRCLDFWNESYKIVLIHIQEFSFYSFIYSFLQDFFDSSDQLGVVDHYVVVDSFNDQYIWEGTSLKLTFFKLYVDVFFYNITIFI